MIQRNYFLLLFCISSHFLFAQDFLRVEEQANITHVNTSNGVAVADYDQDGYLDMYIVAYGSFSYSLDSTWNRLLRNKGDGTFEDVTIAAGLDVQFFNGGIAAARGEKMGAAWGDYDNDGYPDLFLTNSRKDQLYHNNGDGTFSDVTAQAGVEGCFECYSGSGLWWDYNRDGYLDLYVSILNGANIMYENKKDGTFENITEKVGLGSNNLAITWTSIALDVNGDGYLDLYDINDTQANKLWLNEGGNNFKDATLAYRLGDEGAGMGVTVGDYDNDGDFDIYVTNIYDHHPNPLFRNDDHLRYTDVAVEMGVANSGWGWGTHFFDYDHDGDEDLYAVNGPIDKLYGVPQQEVNNFFFKNTLVEGTLGFQDWSVASGANALTSAKGLEVFDYDGDGDLDMIVANQNTSPYLYRNETINGPQPPSKNWLQIQLEGTVSNRNAFGAEVKITVADRSYYRYHHGAGFFGQSVKPVHFGVGSAKVIDELLVIWPSGLRDTLFDVPANQILKVEETERSSNPNVPIRAPKELSYNFPNPFYNGTTLHFELPRAGNLTVKIYASSGEKLFQSSQAIDKSGVLEIPWGAAVTSGMYYYLADFESQIENRQFRGKMVKP